MTKPITIEKIRLSGFRAFLKPQEILLREDRKRSLAVLARNSLGKSSLIDSLEYYFDEAGTLDILGKNKSENKAGSTALQHVDAKKHGIDTSVHVWFSQGGESFGEPCGDPRQFKAPLTSTARAVLGIAKVPFVIRGSNLRQFIDEPTGTDRYEMLTKWLNLRPLYTVQDNLHTLKRKMKDIANDPSDADVQSRLVALETDNFVSSFDEPAILNWFNGNVLAALDDSLRLESLSDGDPALQEMKCKAEAERKGSGLDVRENLVTTIDGVCEWITSFETAIHEFENATIRTEAARDSNSKIAFNDIWQDAERLLDNDGAIHKCPVCCTEFVSSKLKSREKVREHLRKSIARLKEYHQAENARKSAEDNLVKIKDSLDRELELLFRTPFSSLSGPEQPRNDIDNYLKASKSWKVGEKAFDSGHAVSELTRLRNKVTVNIERIGHQQGELTYDGALDKARRLLDIKSEFRRIERAMAVKKSIHDSLEKQVRKFNDAIINHIRSLVEDLRTETNRIYKEIRGTDEKVPEIRIELPDEGAAKQRFARLLLTDFADGHRELDPGSYLSESQIHALALALQFAAIRMFNAEAKIIALDDIMLSQDVDHRSNITAVLSNCFDDFQVIVTTYDTLSAILIGAAIPSFGPSDARVSRRPGKNTSGDLKGAKILRGSKAGIVLFLTVMGTSLLMIGGIDAASACSLSTHCYAQWYAQWSIWPGITGDREEYGVKSTMNTVEISDDDGLNNFVVHAQWVVHNSGKWVEIGIIRGDFPGCPTLAEHAEKYYWTSWNGTFDSSGGPVVEGECVSAPSVGSATVELSDTDKDGDWIYKVGSTTINTETNDFGKGYLQIGGESTDADNTLDGDFSSLKYYDTAWRTWTHHRDQVAGSALGIEECSASSANVGDDPSCN